MTLKKTLFRTFVAVLVLALLFVVVVLHFTKAGFLGLPLGMFQSVESMLLGEVDEIVDGVENALD